MYIDIFVVNLSKPIDHLVFNKLIEPFQTFNKGGVIIFLIVKVNEQIRKNFNKHKLAFCKHLRNKKTTTFRVIKLEMKH